MSFRFQFRQAPDSRADAELVDATVREGLRSITKKLKQMGATIETMHVSNLGGPKTNAK